MSKENLSLSQQSLLKKSLVWGLPVLMGTLVLAGCGQDKTKETALLDSQNLESYAGVEGSEQQGSAQTLVEVIPTPAGPEGTQGALITPVTDAIAATQAAAAQSAKSVTLPTGTLKYEQRIQAALAKAGLYSGAIDGKIGPKTREAIKVFQEQEGLKADGIVGAITWERMRKYLNGTAGAAQAPASFSEGSELPPASNPQAESF